MADDGFVLLGEFIDPGDVFFRYDEHMHGRLRLNVMERDDLIVLIHLLGGDLSRYDFAKDAITHKNPLNSFSLFYSVQ
ncbi:hypothetical protein SDC9_129142 [bioreactor metagenome]|uniref:Uncharacterized protein n=1 Tax=bioreactor metagenome TaxID=1076179 RepID=A0A645CYP4_9ZZZZ